MALSAPAHGSLFGALPSLAQPQQSQQSQPATAVATAVATSTPMTATATAAAAAAAAAGTTSSTMPSTTNSGSPPVPAPPSSTDTYIMPNPTLRAPHGLGIGAVGAAKMPFPPPRLTRTLGQRPSCLVNASITYCGDNQIYAFGGFDQYTDEVYNQVRRLDLVSHQWTLVDNYGDIPGVRMGHTATLYQGHKLLVFGGENEHRNYLSDLIIFDTKTAHWTQPQLHGTPPTGRARHAAVLHDDKLFIMGGISGLNNYVLDDICFLDLRTYTWSRSWRFVPRFDHAAHVHDGRVWIFGGLDPDSNRAQRLWWMDIKGIAAFDSTPPVGSLRPSRSGTRPSPRPPLGGFPMVGPPRPQLHPPPPPQAYAANSATAQVNTPSFQIKGYSPQSPAPVSSLEFQPHGTVPPQGIGCHFHAYSSGLMLDFLTPVAGTPRSECALYSLDLATFKWQQLAAASELFKPGYKWHYVMMNEDRTKAWLVGCPDTDDHMDESLSDILEVDLRRYGVLGNSNGLESPPMPSSSYSSASPMRAAEQTSKGLSADLARLFDQPPEAGSCTDFIITAAPEDPDITNTDPDADDYSDSPASERAWSSSSAAADSPPIHVHRLILQARWPHFARLYNAQMREFHTKKMHIPEPYPIVRAFLHYLYTDSIEGPPPVGGPDALQLRRPGGGPPSTPANPLSIVSGLLVLSNVYMLPHLRHLCVNRLSRELDTEHACLIWYRAGLANEDWLRRRAAHFCMQNWGRVVRTTAFAGLPRNAMIELTQASGTGSRVFDEDEVEEYVWHREAGLDDEYMMG